MRSSVVLPAPFGPSSTTASPARTTRSTPASTGVPAKARTRPSARIGGSPTSFLADDHARRDRLVGPEEDHALALGRGQHHALALDAAELRGLQVRDHHHLAADQRRGLVVRPDAGHQLPLLAAAQVDAQHEQPVGVRVRLGGADRPDLELERTELLDRDHDRPSPRSSAAIASSACASKRARMPARSSSVSLPIWWSSSASLMAASPWRFCRSPPSASPPPTRGATARGRKSGAATKNDAAAISARPSR